MTSWPGQPKAPANPHRKFPPETCGDCKFAPKDADGNLLCIVMPPTQLIDQDGEIVSLRGSEVDSTDPACYLFKHRQNA